MVVDGCLRDIAAIKQLGLGLWLRGATPNFHTQTVQFPAAINVPIACGGALVLPGDLIVADDDGAVVVPAATPQLLERAGAHAEWEEFSRLRLAEGGDLRKYYPSAKKPGRVRGLEATALTPSGARGRHSGRRPEGAQGPAQEEWRDGGGAGGARRGRRGSRGAKALRRRLAAETRGVPPASRRQEPPARPVPGG